MNSQNFLDHYGYFLLRVSPQKVSEVSILFVLLFANKIQDYD